MSSRPVQGKRGFTLVEVIVSATIFCLVCVGVGSVFFAGMKIWNRAQQGTIYQEDAVIDLEIIAKELRQAIKIKQAGFSGSENSFSFVSLEAGKIEKYIYSFDEMRKSLLQKKQSYRDILEEKEAQGEREFMKGLDNFRIKYLSFNEKDSKTEWSNIWDEKKGYPLAVSFEGQKKKFKFHKTVFIPITGTQ